MGTENAYHHRLLFDNRKHINRSEVVTGVGLSNMHLEFAMCTNASRVTDFMLKGVGSLLITN